MASHRGRGTAPSSDADYMHIARLKWADLAPKAKLEHDRRLLIEWLNDGKGIAAYVPISRVLPKDDKGLAAKLQLDRDLLRMHINRVREKGVGVLSWQVLTAYTEEPQERRTMHTGKGYTDCVIVGTFAGDVNDVPEPLPVQVNKW